MGLTRPLRMGQKRGEQCGAVRGLCPLPWALGCWTPGYILFVGEIMWVGAPVRVGGHPSCET